MGKLSAEQQKTLDDLTALANAPDADDDEVWVKNPDGHETKLTGARAAAWLKRHGYEPDEGDQAAADADARAAGTGTPAKKAVPAKKTAPPAKKAAPAAAGEESTEDGAEEELAREDDDAGPTPNRRAFF